MSGRDIDGAIEAMLAELEAQGARLECDSVRDALSGGLDPQLAHAERQRELVRRQAKREQLRSIRAFGGAG